jgi:Domain of unknown function (DUF4263)
MNPGRPLASQLRQSLKLSIERKIRAQCSEHVITQAHDGVYAPVKGAIAQVNGAILAQLSKDCGVDPTAFPGNQHHRDIATLRTLIENNAKERELQDALVETGLLALDCKVIQEVAMKPTGNYVGMRMDLVLHSRNDEPAQIIELKRGSHLLLARQGKPAERLSQEITKAIDQVKSYGTRVETDSETAFDLEKGHGIRFDKPKLRLIAGRRPTSASGYHLLSNLETVESDSSLQLQIYTWDGFLAELERIYD